MYGGVNLEGSSVFADGPEHSVHLARIDAVLHKAYDNYTAPKTEGHSGKGWVHGLNCSMRHDRSLVLLTSSALPNTELKHAFREMVLRLPDSAWKSAGSEKKKLARGKEVKDNFFEPDLYGGLRVLILEDAVFLKNSFWNRKNENFGQAMGVNYNTTGMATSVDLVRKATQGFHGLDGGWGCDYASSDCGGLGGFGFDKDAFTHISIFDLLASDEMKEAIFKLQSQGKVVLSQPLPKASTSSAAAKRFLELLNSTDVIAVNGGNPDFVKYVFTVFAGELMEKVKARIEEGSLVYLGRSAGAMIGSADVGLTYEPDPVLLDHLNNGKTGGLALAGWCAIRPHYKDDMMWDITTSVYEEAKHLNELRVPNGAGVGCMDAKCKMYGLSEGKSTFQTGDQGSVHLGRINYVLDKAYNGYHPA